MTSREGTPWTAERLAEDLLDAEATRTARTSVQADWPELDLDTAYEVQDLALQRRLARGERLVGVKLGVTSRAKQQQVGVDSPNVAWLTSTMRLPAGEPLVVAEQIHPRAEPEIAFVLGRRLEGPGVGPEEALAAVDSVLGAVELIDSRFAGYSFTAVDATADNASSGRFVLGSVPVPPGSLDLMLEAVVLERDGEVVDTATGAAVYGHPAEALAFAANQLAERGLALEAGWVVLTGGMTDALPLAPGTSVSAQFTHLGVVTVRAV
ncbi:fumarylacetoacetate hydrolase family protein [Janibacter melonis]|uniref:2-keto-4-pentenoate hydratase n=1 Tax=Janibacter melonis TaxID=262209 RepID=UPI0020446D61|nr:fumarylacetoacetate hydrolase family protein [Janibacter melonis]MCM3555753.1 fumarylacetoacetate hydrolase family protein [Janibacter melonis]